MGRSGSGKGTQAKLLQDYINAKDAEKHPFFYVETGARFRQFIEGEPFANKLAKQIYEEGGRQPDFLAIWIWSHVVLENMTGNEHLILDGTPRSLPESYILDTAMKFFKREKPNIIHIDVSRKWSMEKLLARGRADDKTAHDIDKRLDWFDKDVTPAFTFFENNPDYNYVKVNGELSIEEVQREIIKGIGI